VADAPRYYRVSPKFWSSAERNGWDDDTRLLALYILTCEHRTTEGLFRLPKQYILADLEWSKERLAQPFARLCNDGFIEYDHKAKVVLIVKALAYQSPNNPNGVTAALRALEMVPETSLDQRFYALCQQNSQRLAEQLPERFTQPIGDPPALALAPAPSPAPEEPSATADDARPDPEEGFEQFWTAYPRGKAGKPGGDGTKKLARRKWSKLKRDQRQAALDAVAHYAAHVNSPEGPFAAHAETWLNQERWETWATPAEAGDARRAGVSFVD